MKKILYIVFTALLLAGCDEFIMDIPHTAPYARTGDVLELDGLSVTLSGSFGNMETEYGVLCFYVSEYEDFSTCFEYMIDIRDYEALDSGKITAVFDDLMPNRTYYYKFGVVHGTLENGVIYYISRAEVWGDVKTFVSEDILLKDIKIQDYAYYHTLYASGELETYVRYYVELCFSPSMLEEIQNDYQEYGFYAIADDGSFEEYTSKWGFMNSESISYLLDIDKEAFKISRASGFYHAETSGCKIGFYVIDKNSELIRLTEQHYSGFEYSLQPKIEVLGVNQGEKIVDEDGIYPIGYVPYSYSYIIEGALFFDTFTAYVRDDIFVNRTYNDQEEGFKTLASVYPYTEAKVEYLYWTAVVDGVTIIPDQCIKFDYNGYGNVEISISSYVPETPDENPDDGLEQDKDKPLASSATDLASSGETANCYIVSSAGTYKFKPVKGNSSTSVGSVSSVEVLWESFGTSQKPSVGDLIRSVNYDSGFIVFSTSPSFKEGNAVIAAKNSSGEILWSWHIWLTDQPEEQVYYNNAGTMMDRNLGATSATPGDVGALGLLYQWGRKDPFLGSSSISDEVEAKSTVTWPSAVSTSSSKGNVDYVTANPMTFILGTESSEYDWYYSSRNNDLWTSSKTIYDPCPVGWRVPDGDNNGVWSKACGSSSEIDYYPFDLSEGGMNFSGKFGSASSIWYSASGYRRVEDGSLYNVGLEGFYWSVSRGHYYFWECASCLNFRYYRGRVYPSYDGYRATGQSVRCLQE